MPLQPCARLCAIVLLIVPLDVASGQTSELWPELDVYWRPAEHQRTMLELSASAEREGSKREATVGLYQDYLRLPMGYVRGGYRFTFSTRDASYRESRIVTEIVASRHVARVRLLNRLRPEFRWINGEYSYRVRDRVHVQRMSSDRSRPVTGWYGTIEAYYDSRYRTIARIGARIGYETHMRGRAWLDLYLARQNNSRPAWSYVNALGATVKLEY